MDSDETDDYTELDANKAVCEALMRDNLQFKAELTAARAKYANLEVKFFHQQKERDNLRVERARLRIWITEKGCGPDCDVNYATDVINCVCGRRKVLRGE